MHAGRFAHEAAAYSPAEGYVYLTEDNFGFPSGFYRYVPPTNPMAAGHLEDGGQLQMLKVVGVTKAHLEAHQTIGATYRGRVGDDRGAVPGHRRAFGPCRRSPARDA